jgi:hypothetical protein
VRSAKRSQCPLRLLAAVLVLPHCDSDGARALFDRELARADVVPMHRMQRVWPSGASVGRPTRASSQRRRRRPHVARNRLCADRGGRRCRACKGDTITAARVHGALVAGGLRVNRGCAYARCVLPAGEDVARVADVAGVERLVAPVGRGSARCSSARRTRGERVRLRFACERCRTWPPKKAASPGLEDSSDLKTLVFRSDGAEPVACLVRVVGALDSARAERPRRKGAFAGQRSSPPHRRDA